MCFFETMFDSVGLRFVDSSIMISFKFASYGTRLCALLKERNRTNQNYLLI